MAVTVTPHSRLNFARLLQTDGVVYWDMLELPEIPEQSDDIVYEVRSTDRIDLLAFRFYGDPVLWWVIAAANDLEILPTDFETAATIRIPSPRYVLQRLFTNITPKVTT